MTTGDWMFQPGAGEGRPPVRGGGVRSLAGSRGRLAAAVVLWILLMACEVTPKAAPVASSAPDRAAPVTSASPVRIGGPGRGAASLTDAPLSPDALVELAVADAAARTGVAASQVQSVSVSPREWADRSLGCPQPGMGYAQAITPGFLILLEAGGRQLAYHTDHTQIVHCDR